MAYLISAFMFEIKSATRENTHMRTNFPLDTFRTFVLWEKTNCYWYWWVFWRGWIVVRFGWRDTEDETTLHDDRALRPAVVAQITTLIYPESLLLLFVHIPEHHLVSDCLHVLVTSPKLYDNFPCEGQEGDLLCSPFWKCKWRNNILPLIRLLGVRHCGSHRQSLCCQHYLIVDALLGAPSGFETWQVILFLVKVNK